MTRVTPSGLVDATGAERQVDVLILSTGFQPTSFLKGIEVKGRDGRDIHDAWQGRPNAFMGITVAGFPNFFILYGPNSNLGSNSIIYMLESQIGYVMGALRALEAEGLGWLDVRREADDAFADWAQLASRKTVWETGCHNWYTGSSGRNTNNWPGYTFMYRHRVRRFDRASYQASKA